MSDSEACANGDSDQGSAFTLSEEPAEDSSGSGPAACGESEDKSECNMEESGLLEGTGRAARVSSKKHFSSKKKHGRFHVKIIRETDKASSLKRNGDMGKASMSPSQQESVDESLDHSLAAHSFGHTVEAIPSLDHYRNRYSLLASGKQRPTLYELHEPKTAVNQTADTPVDAGGLAEIEAPPTTAASGGVKFGWIKGVLVRCLLNIWGVMLFLRMSWIVGQAGIGFSILIVMMATVVTVLTTLSMSAICTNGEVKGGGAYYMISRSLGPEFGGSIGLIFSIANAVAVAMYVVGFAEVVRDLLVDNGLKIIDPDNDVRIIGEATLVLLLGITMIGMAWEARAQLFLLLLLVIAICNMMVGTFIPAPDHEIARGFQNYRGALLVENFGPDYRDGEGFFSIFSIFFPAATGILAGANISGDLKDAQKAIPKGTLIAIAMTSVSYAGLAIVLGSCVSREATGNIADVIAGNFTTACEDGFDCEYGLLKNFSVASLISGWAPLVLAGVFAATLSSALASLVSAPKVFQALCKDKIFPKIGSFAVGTGPGDEPRRAYILAFFIAAACIAIGELNAIAPIISNFFLMSYALINFSCFSASLAKSPGWRPAFRYYNMWVALLAAVLCMGVMFLINWYAALITIFIVTALYMYVHNTKPEINWGSSNQAFIYKQALTNTLKLNHIPAHVKTFRPQIIALTGLPECRPALAHFVSHITKSTSLLICGAVLTGEQSTNLNELTTDYHEKWLDSQKIKAFPAMVASPTLRAGAQALMQIGGLGKIRPNTIIMGFLGRWKTEKSQYVNDYVGIIHDAFDLNLGVGILRIKESFDVSSALNTPGFSDYVEGAEKVPEIKVESMVSSIKEEEKEGEEVAEPSATEPPNSPVGTKISMFDSTALIKGKPIDDVIKSMQKFQEKMPKGNIDVWWLLDDGGLTLLIPHLLSMKSNWEKCKLRVFATTGKKEQIDRERMNMANMLSKFRIKCTDVEIISDLNKKPKEESLRRFEELINPWILKEGAGETAEKFPWKITKDEVTTLKEKTTRQIRIRELLREHSREAQLIVMSLPIPRKLTCSAYMYMCWLETLTKDMPPILLLRGNQTSVLTHYS
ncbi:solute carrier family 12 member 2-like isoform X2 [Acanthaster planci]|uniref:Solute carrier family 12 member 2-like isoform X2 n=1 Tax=Acanthaster planci TaxID=133434 RepID=A0A8B7Y325_ACAPL|nr:solute carrier family 12 member 2-like isoform X2 [Acanthaster planci]